MLTTPVHPVFSARSLPRLLKLSGDVPECFQERPLLRSPQVTALRCLETFERRALSSFRDLQCALSGPTPRLNVLDHRKH